MRKGLRFAGAALLLCGALSVCGGCAASRSGPGATAHTGEAAAPAHVIPGVPFLPQEDDSCGPSSLAMLLRFRGKDVTTAELVRETRTEGLRGTLITDLAAAARRRGVPAEVVDLDVPALRERIARGEPVILLVDLGVWVWSRPHYLLAYGVTAEGVVANSGSSQGKVIPYRTLEGEWAKMGNLAIVAPVAGK
ncbi:MAG TPA: cysteine peptidase family C39 domain-containing protein [Candidatus Deferrimicrobiaceae bacterium]